jgi:hypothetical protein
MVCGSRVNLDPLRLASHVHVVVVRTVAADLRALPLVRSGIIPQKGRPVGDDRRGKVKRARECVAVASAEIPFRIEAAGARKEFVVEEARRKSRDRGINIHVVIVVLLGNWSSKRIRRS